MLTIDRIDRMPMKISYPVFLSSLWSVSASAIPVPLVRFLLSLRPLGARRATTAARLRIGAPTSPRVDEGRTLSYRR